MFDIFVNSTNGVPFGKRELNIPGGFPLLRGLEEAPAAVSSKQTSDDGGGGDLTEGAALFFLRLLSQNTGPGEGGGGR